MQGENPQPGAITSPPEPKEGVKERVAKYIPAEAIAVYMTLQGLVASADRTITAEYSWLPVVILAFGLAATAVYLWRSGKAGEPWVFHLIVGLVAFLFWVGLIGGEPINRLFPNDQHRQLLMGLLTTAFTIAAGWFAPGPNGWPRLTRD